MCGAPSAIPIRQPIEVPTAMKSLAQYGIFFFFIFISIFTLTADDIHPEIREAEAIGLPDPLITLNGSVVDTPEKWFTTRRDELIQLFQYYVYGYMPDAPKIAATLGKYEEGALGGRADYYEVRIDFPELPQAVETTAGMRERPRIIVSLFVPSSGTGPYPAFIGINRCGNHTVVPYSGITIFSKTHAGGHCLSSEKGRGTHTSFWSVADVIDRGYAFATFHESDVDSDRVDDTDGIQPFYHDRNAIDSEHVATEWGTIGVWAWGVSRVIDTTRMAVVGHSRRGKAALLAAAFDERIDLVIPHQAGTGAEALSRGLLQEPPFIMNNAYPHWYNEIYKSYNFRLNRLPVDQHELLALVAPRGVLLTAALSYLWAGPGSAHRAMKGAEPVFKLLGGAGMYANGIIPSDASITVDMATGLSQYRRAKGHRLDPAYWRVFIDYADAFYEGRVKRRESGMALGTE